MVLHSLGLLQAVKPERDIPCCLCAKTKAAQMLSLQKQNKFEYLHPVTYYSRLAPQK